MERRGMRRVKSKAVNTFVLSNICIKTTKYGSFSAEGNPTFRTSDKICSYPVAVYEATEGSTYVNPYRTSYFFPENCFLSFHFSPASQRRMNSPRGRRDLEIVAISLDG